MNIAESTSIILQRIFLPVIVSSLCVYSSIQKTMMIYYFTMSGTLVPTYETYGRPKQAGKGGRKLAHQS